MATAKGVRAGRAYVELFSDDSKLVRGLTAAERRLTAFGGAVRSIGLKMVGLGSAIAAPLAGMAKLFADVGSQLQDMAERTGISGQALSELKFAAEQSGASLGDLETSVKRMQKTLVDAAGGSQGAIDALAALGLTASDLQSLAPEQQLEAIADGLAGIDDPAKRTAAAMEVLGKSGTALLPLLKNGAKGIEAFKLEARAAGLSMTNEQIAAADAFGDSIGKLTAQLKMAGIQIGAALAPTLQKISAIIAEATVATIDWVKRNGELITTAFKSGAAIAAVGAALAPIGFLLSGVGSAFGVVAGAARLFGSALGGVQVALGIGAPLCTALAIAIGGVGSAWAKAAIDGSTFGEAVARIAGQVGVLDNAVTQLDRNLERGSAITKILREHEDALASRDGDKQGSDKKPEAALTAQERARKNAEALHAKTIEDTKRRVQEQADVEAQAIADAAAKRTALEQAIAARDNDASLAADWKHSFTIDPLQEEVRGLDLVAQRSAIVRRGMQADLDGLIAKQKAAGQAAAESVANAEKLAKAAAPAIDGVLDSISSTPLLFAKSIADAMKLSQDAIEQVGAAVLAEQTKAAEALLSGKGIDADALATMKAETQKQQQLNSAVETLAKARGIDPAMIRKQLEEANSAVSDVARKASIDIAGGFSSNTSGLGVGRSIDQKQLETLGRMERLLFKIEKKEGGVMVFSTILMMLLSALSMGTIA